MAPFFNNQNVLEIIWKWKIHLTVVGLLAIILSAIFSSPTYITPKFKSTARIYPSVNIYTYSNESESEQLLEFINSLDIKLKVIEDFNLSEVYKINKEDPLYMTYMLGEFNDNVTFKKTEYETIEIEVLDADPNRACAMCDSIISYYNQTIKRIHSKKYFEVVTIAEDEIGRYDHQIDSVRKIMDDIRKNYKILDYKTQAKEVTRGMVNFLSEQRVNTQGGKEIKQWMNNLMEKGGEYDYLSNHLNFLQERRDSVLKVKEWSLSSATKSITYYMPVQNPIPADKKSYPVRWLIVMMSMLSSLFLALLVILLIENRKTA